MSFPDAGSVVGLLLWGGWVAVDATGCGQFMLSRPLVAATVAGALVGDPVAGAVLGVVLEAFSLSVLPVGAARYPEGGPPAVVAGAAFALSSQSASQLLTMLAFFVGWEWVGGQSVRWMRQLNIRIASFSSQPLRTVRSLEKRHLLSVGVDFVRGVVLVALGGVVLSLLLTAVRLSWAAGERLPQLLLAAGVAGLLASTLRLFGGRARLFLAGALCGLLFLLARL